MPPSDGLITYVSAGVTAVVSALAAAVAMLWKTSESRNAQAIASLEGKVTSLEGKQEKSEAAILECEKDRSHLRGICDSLTKEIAGLRASLKGNT